MSEDKVTKLRAVKPEGKEKRLKMLVYGPAGVGKTTACLQFPRAYIIDTERGTDFYAETINKAESAVLQTFNPETIKEELHALLTAKHNYRTLIIDPVTQIYNAVQERWTKIFEKNCKTENEIGDFGMRYWGKVKGEFKALQRLMLALDMNVIVTSHQKDVYGNNFSKIGVTFDSMRGDDYLFDLVFQVERVGKVLIARTIKERAEIGKQKFSETFVWSYQNFCKFYGKEIIEKESKAVDMATPEQVAELTRLIEVVKIPDGTVDKWLEKAGADNFEELTAEQISKCVEYVKNQIKGVK